MCPCWCVRPVTGICTFHIHHLGLNYIYNSSDIERNLKGIFVAILNYTQLWWEGKLNLEGQIWLWRTWWGLVWCPEGPESSYIREFPTVASIISNETSYHIFMKCHLIQRIKISVDRTNSFEFGYQASILLMNTATGWKNDMETHTNKWTGLNSVKQHSTLRTTTKKLFSFVRVWLPESHSGT